ncbi:hypothetical protein K440DRAFT_664275 [Wilcoxina mikolae CBS 423.85]|nr:hypothetical protein K440DRAFT_664275 [Wilcoxina mikolae CBS 423.85]
MSDVQPTSDLNVNPPGPQAQFLAGMQGTNSTYSIKKDKGCLAFLEYDSIVVPRVSTEDLPVFQKSDTVAADVREAQDTVQMPAGPRSNAASVQSTREKKPTRGGKRIREEQEGKEKEGEGYTEADISKADKSGPNLGCFSHPYLSKRKIALSLIKISWSRTVGNTWVVIDPVTPSPELSPSFSNPAVDKVDHKNSPQEAVSGTPLFCKPEAATSVASYALPLMKRNWNRPHWRIWSRFPRVSNVRYMEMHVAATNATTHRINYLAAGSEQMKNSFD